APEGETRLLIAIHHLSVDGVSWRVLLEELQTAYEQAERGEAVVLPAGSTPWRAWVRALMRYARSSELTHELAWWQTALDAPALRAGPLFPARSPRPQPQKTLRTNLSADLTAALLREAPRAYRLRVDQVLLAALARAVCDVAVRDEVLIELEGHGREDLIEGVDLSRTIGWFTTQYPLAVPGACASPADALRRVHERLATVPRRGFGWGLLSRCADEPARAALDALPVPEIGFNYLGRFEQTFRATARFSFASEPSGATIAEHARMPDRALDINGWVAGDSLSLSWGYAPQFVSDMLAERIVAAFERTLSELLDHLSVAQTPSLDAADAKVKLPAVPATLEAQAVRDDVAASWAARAVYEAALPAPSAHALASWFARRRAAISSNAAQPVVPAQSDLLLPAVPLNALGAPVTLFGLPPGYGMVGEYRSLAQALNGRVTLIALQAPALRGAPWHGGTFEALAEYFAGCIDALQPGGECALIGWSFGGRLAVAIAEHFERRGRRLSFVGIVDTATSWDDGPEPPAAAHDAQGAFDETAVTHAGPSLLSAAFAADAMHAALMARHTLPRIAADLHVWRALRTRHTRRRMDWERHTAGQVGWFDVDATHTSIVHHPALSAQILRALGADRAR
ncbi:non-ribosomal peptide synthase domain TIGR01720, partial [Trinickia caryophylli]